MKTFSFGRSKSTTLRFWTAQSHQTCVGAYKRGFKFESMRFGDAKMFAQVAYQTIRLPILLADRPEPTNATMLPFYQSGNLETYEPTTMETLKSGDLQTYKLGKSMLHSLVAHKGPADFHCFKCFRLVLKIKGNARLFKLFVWQRKCPQFF